MKIKRNFTTPELEQLADFAMKVNSTLDGASIFCSNHREQILQELIECADENILVSCDIDNNIAGACWLFIDKERCNADTNLLVAPKYRRQYDELAKDMLYELAPTLPKEMEYTFYFPKQNQSCTAFLTKLGARRNTDEYELLLRRDKAKGLVDSNGVELLTPTDYNEFALLHDTIFPDIYINGREIVDSIGKNRTVFVLKENGQITAYSVLEKKSESRSCAEVIGVRDGFRHSGRGRQVLSHLIQKAFAAPEIQYLDLIVDCNNENALKLYFDLGFEVEFENNNFTLTVNSPGAKKGEFPESTV